MLHHGFRISAYLPTDILAGLAQDQEQPDKKRWAALMGLSGQDTPQAFAVISAALSADDPDMRRYALEALSRHPQAAEAEEAILAKLFDVDDLVRQTACKICGQLQFQQAHDGILHFLRADNPEVRDIALNTLGLLWREPDFEPVFQIHRQDEQRSVRIAAAKTLRGRVSSQTWRKLFGVWREDRETRHRLWSCELAQEFGSRHDLPAVEPLLADRNEHVRRAAQRSIAKLACAV